MIAEPFPSPPKRAGAYVLELSKIEDGPDLGETILIFAARYAAKKFMLAVLEDDAYEIEGDVLVSTSGIVVEYTGVATSSLTAIMGHEFTIPEMGWALPHPYDGYAHYFRHHRHDPTPEEIAAAAEKNKPRRQRSHGGGSMHRAGREGMVPIADIALGLGLTARDARGLLRKAKIAKPASGWAWPLDQVDEIKAVIGKLK